MDLQSVVIIAQESFFSVVHEEVGMHRRREEMGNVRGGEAESRPLKVDQAHLEGVLFVGFGMSAKEDVGLFGVSVSECSILGVLLRERGGSGGGSGGRRVVLVRVVNVGERMGQSSAFCGHGLEASSQIVVPIEGGEILGESGSFADPFVGDYLALIDGIRVLRFRLHVTARFPNRPFQLLPILSVILLRPKSGPRPKKGMHPRQRLQRRLALLPLAQQPPLIPPLPRRQILQQKAEFRFQRTIVVRSDIGVETFRNSHVRRSFEFLAGARREKVRHDEMGANVSLELEGGGARFFEGVGEGAEVDGFVVGGARRGSVVVVVGGSGSGSGSGSSGEEEATAVGHEAAEGVFGGAAEGGARGGGGRGKVQVAEEEVLRQGPAVEIEDDVAPRRIRFHLRAAVIRLQAGEEIHHLAGRRRVRKGRGRGRIVVRLVKSAILDEGGARRVVAAESRRAPWPEVMAGQRAETRWR
mmetsp:Transcript_3495/g.7056  ORF Transcript_3495/g.7056 Transcript_3495/m.7056 type:complete len:470 (-) Transcript_3495:295-1704(-)